MRINSDDDDPFEAERVREKFRLHSNPKPSTPEADSERKRWIVKRGPSAKFSYLEVSGEYIVRVTRVLVVPPEQSSNHKYRITMHAVVINGPHEKKKVGFKCDVADLNQLSTSPRLDEAIELAVGHEIYDDDEFDLDELFSGKYFRVRTGRNLQGSRDNTKYVRIHRFLEKITVKGVSS